MAQFENDGFGFFERVNFGKYYDKENKKTTTVYDIANLRDFKYLVWLVSPKFPKKGESSFHVSSSLIAHAKAALRLQGEDSIWTETFEQDSKDKTLWIKQYITNDGKLEGPKIIYRQCGVCNKRKNEAVVKKQQKKYICDHCMKDLFGEEKEN